VANASKATKVVFNCFRLLVVFRRVRFASHALFSSFSGDGIDDDDGRRLKH
jgi:hypothetical protein